MIIHFLEGVAISDEHLAIKHWFTGLPTHEVPPVLFHQLLCTLVFVAVFLFVRNWIVLHEER